MRTSWEELHSLKRVMRNFGFRQRACRDSPDGGDAAPAVFAPDPAAVAAGHVADPLLPFSCRLAAFERHMDALQFFFVWIVEDNELRITVEEDIPATEAVLLKHFPDAYFGGSGGGLWSYDVPSFDSSLEEGSFGEGAINKYKRLEFLRGARWVQVTPETLFVWWGGENIQMFQVDGIWGGMSIVLKGEPTLEEVRDAIQRDIERHKHPPEPGSWKVVSATIDGKPVDLEAPRDKLT